MVKQRVAVLKQFNRDYIYVDEMVAYTYLFLLEQGSSTNTEKLYLLLLYNACDRKE